MAVLNNVGFLCFLATVLHLYTLTYGLSVQHLNEECNNYNRFPISYENLTMTSDNGKDYISIIIRVKENIPTSLKSTEIFEKCNADFTKCSTVLKNKESRYCNKINSGTSVLSGLYKAMTPQWKCPLKKGVYKLTNKELDLKMLSLIGLRGTSFKIKQEIFDTQSKKQLLCVSGRGLP